MLNAIINLVSLEDNRMSLRNGEVDIAFNMSNRTEPTLEYIEKQELRFIILSLIERMRNPLYQIILINRYYKGRTKKQIAEQLGYRGDRSIRFHEPRALFHLGMMLMNYYPEYCSKKSNGNGREY